MTIGHAPVFDADSPSLTATNGRLYSYTFRAKGDPAPGYALGSGSPSWLHIDASSGTVRGTVPDWATSFSYSVTAANSVGSATAGPYWVHITRHRAVVATSPSCTPRVFSGKEGSCTLSVSNVGHVSAPNVIVQVSLPSQLRAVLRSLLAEQRLPDQRQHRV